jgi:flagellar hook-associated protein FlgK
MARPFIVSPLMELAESDTEDKTATTEDALPTEAGSTIATSGVILNSTAAMAGLRIDTSRHAAGDSDDDDDACEIPLLPTVETDGVTQDTNREETFTDDHGSAIGDLAIDSAPASSELQNSANVVTSTQQSEERVSCWVPTVALLRLQCMLVSH